MVSDPPDRPPQEPAGGWTWSEPGGTPHPSPPPADVYGPGGGAPGAPPPRGRGNLLRPRTVTEIVDETFRLYRAHWRILLGLSAIVMVPIGFVTLVLALQFQPFGPDAFPDPFSGDPFTEEPFTDEPFPGVVPPFEMGGFVIANLVNATLALFGTTFLIGAVARVISEAALGRAPSMRDATRFAFAHLWRLLAVAVLFYLSLVGFVFFFVPGFIALAAFRVAPVAVVVEGARVLPSFGRSRRLSKGFRWKVLGTVMLVWLIKSVAGGAVGFAFGIAGFAIGFLTNNMFVPIQIASSVSNTIVQTLAAPMTTAAVTLLYFDLRIRKEAFDLSVMAHELGTPPPS